ncbi:MAG: hypothetical protein FWH33_06165 [Oscillospiraceae bacterium]|nr:hypothetical protein [Oscillospiraceae bacterium]
MEHKLMTEREKADIYMKTIELEEVGRIEESKTLRRTIPIPAYLAKVFKEKVGAEFLTDGGYNLAEAEAKYGSDWLAR